jgi:hypothetical protein
VRFPRAVSQTVPGRLRASVTPVLRPVREVQSLDWDRRGRVTPARPASQEAWPGAESVGASQLASTAVERRKASAPEARRDGNVRSAWRAPGPAGHGKKSARLLALRLPSFWEAVGRAFLQWRGRPRMRKRIARTMAFIRPHESGGRGTTRRVVEGASEMELRCRCRMIVETRAPPTALRRSRRVASAFFT